MKSINFLLIILTLILFIIDHYRSKKTSKKKLRKAFSTKIVNKLKKLFYLKSSFPNIDKIKSDYLSWNTAKYIIQNDLAKSDLEKVNNLVFLN